MQSLKFKVYHRIKALCLRINKRKLNQLLYCTIIFLNVNSNANECNEYLIDTPDNELILVLDANKLFKSNPFGTNRLALSYSALAGKQKLLVQSDPRLNEDELLIMDGGLCGPTCLTNVYLAKVQMNDVGALRYWLNYAQDLVREILDKYMWHILTTSRRMIHDPRMGTYLDIYLTEKNAVLESLGLRSYQADLEATGYNLNFLKSQNALLLASVSFRSTNISTNVNHAVVILGVDTKKKKLFVSDPNHPNQIIITPYKIENGKFTFYLWNDTYVQDGDTSSVVLNAAYYITEDN